MPDAVKSVAVIGSMMTVGIWGTVLALKRWRRQTWRVSWGGSTKALSNVVLGRAPRQHRGRREERLPTEDPELNELWNPPHLMTSRA